MWPFLKELVKLKQVFLWVLRTGCTVRSRLFFLFPMSEFAWLPFVGFSTVGSSRLSSPREVAIVLFKGDCSQNIPSRGTAHGSREQLCLLIVMADADLSGANSSP